MATVSIRNVTKKFDILAWGLNSSPLQQKFDNRVFALGEGKIYKHDLFSLSRHFEREKYNENLFLLVRHFKREKYKYCSKDGLYSLVRHFVRGKNIG